jgi:hypothetical protein
MGTLKTTLKVESTDLFPTPVSFTQINNNGVNGTFSGFNTITPGTTPGIQINAAAIDTSAYVYASTPSSNLAIIQILDGNGEQVCTLVPGDTLFFHYLGATAPLDDLFAVALNATDSVNVFVGERS